MGTITVLYHIDPAVNMRRFWSVRERGRYADVQWGRMDTDGQELTYGPPIDTPSRKCRSARQD